MEIITSTAPPAGTITLKSSDEQFFGIERSIALQSKTLEQTIANNQTDQNIVIPLRTIKGSVLAKVIEYLYKHGEAETSDEDKKVWDEQFVNLDSSDTPLFDVLRAANFLKIQGLVDLAYKQVIKGKTALEICRIFGFQTQNIPICSEEEEAEVRRCLQ
ncbi:hypothetical protein MKX03_001101 [Papaver bracteatum]|nr:hypothetical protein MKX03_001101 [Papaver bracteatum]